MAYVKSAIPRLPIFETTVLEVTSSMPMWAVQAVQIAHQSAISIQMALPTEAVVEQTVLIAMSQEQTMTIG